MPGRQDPFVCFGPFEANLAARELHKNGVRLKLQDQPFRVLEALIERPGEVVTREHLQQRIWGEDTYVDFDKSLSSAVNKVRLALGDSRTRPRFIETIPKVGYRFIHPLESSFVDSSPVPERARRGWWFWPGFCGTVAAVAFAAWFLWARGFAEGEASPLIPLALTAYDGLEFSPSFSPDGSQVAFTWDGGNGGLQALYTKSIGAEEPRKITDHAGEVSSPAWSPNGRSIAYILRVNEGRYELRLVPPAGGMDELVAELRPPSWTGVTARRFDSAPLAWSPDGRFLAVAETLEPAQAQAIFLIDINTRKKRQLTFPEPEWFGDAHARFSHAGDRLAFVRGQTEWWTSQLYILDLDDSMMPAGEPKHLPVHAGERLPWVQSPLWTHDDSEIIASTESSFWRLASHGGGSAKQLPVGSGRAASLSLGGRKLAFVREQIDRDIWRVDRQTGHATPLITSTSWDFFQSFSPDGKQIAWTSLRSGQAEVWVCRADGTGEKQLTFLKNQSGSVAWSPDGRTIAFDSRPNGSADIFLISEAGGSPHPLTSHPGNDATPAWSPDGKTIYFASSRDGTRRIWSMPAAGDSVNARRVSENPGVYPAVSADGKFLYFRSWPFSEGSRILRKRLPDGQETIAIEQVGPWALGKSGVYFTPGQDGSGFGGSKVIRHLDFASGRIEDVFEGHSEIGTISVSPDEETISFVQSEAHADLMIVENFR